MERHFVVVMVGVPVFVFWVRVLAAVARTAWFRRAQRKLQGRGRFLAWYCKALWRTRKPRGSIYLAQQWAQEETNGFRAAG